MRRAILAIAACLLLPHAQAQYLRPMQLCAGEAAYGFPVARRQLDTSRLCRAGYAAEYDNRARIPVWTAYVLTPREATGCGGRDTSFEVDLQLRPDARSTKRDFARSGFDIGHMASDADMRWSSAAGQDASRLSNAAPQLPEFNRGIWKKLEESTRGWAVNRRRPIQVYAGPIYDAGRGRRIGGVTVPHGFWKVIIDTGTREVMVFKFDHEGTRRDLSDFVTTLADVQAATGIVLPMPPGPIYAERAWPRVVKSIGRQKNLACSLAVD